MTTERRLRAPSSLPILGTSLALGEGATQHARVLRLSIGEHLVLFDGRGGEALATVEQLEPELRVRVGEHREAKADRGPVLVQCLPKGKKLDEIVRAATEIGVSEIHLALSARTIARPDEERARGRLERLERIAEEALRQSEGPVLPRLHAPMALALVAARAPAAAARLVLSPREGVPFGEALRAGDGPPWLLVGPEGGLDEAESRALTSAGWTLARIDAHVMRTETAGPVAVALARALYRTRDAE